MEKSVYLRKPGKLRRFFHTYKTGLAFFLPFFLLFVLFILVPVLISFVTSLCRYDLINPPSFAGLSNYAQVFLEDDVFLLALKNTLVIAAVSGPAGYLASFLMAWFIHQVRFKRLYSLAFYAPSICSAIAMSTVWLYLFSGDRYGFVNNVLFRLGVITEPIQWNTNVHTILPVVILISVWMSMGSGFLVFLAGFQNIPASLYEAARVDGATEWEMFWKITLPMITPVLLLTTVYTIVASTIEDSQVVNYIIANAFNGEHVQFEFSAAMGWVYFLFVLALVGIVFAAMRPFIKRVAEV